MKTRIKNFFPSLTFSSLFSRLPLSYLLLPFLTFFAASVASAQIPSSGLVGYWPFNGNANDESGNGNNGTVNSATLTADRFGNANSAYQFDGSTTISIPHNQLLGIQQNQYFSVSLWAKKNPGVTYAHLIGKRPTGASVYNWQIADWQGVQFDGTASSVVYGVLSNQPINSQAWDHIVGVYDNGTWSLYINSILILTNQTSYFTADVNTPVTIGNSGGYNGFPGLIDDVSIYNVALTPNEITQLYTDQTSTVATPPCPTLATNLQTGLVGYWPFCGNANDESGNGNNGTVNGATLTTDRFGNANSAYVFSGGANISVPHNANQNISSVGTWSAWVDASSFPAAGTTSQLISKYNSNLNQRSYVLELELSKFKHNVHDGITWHSVTSATSMQINEWRQVTVVFDKTASPSLKLYLDGTLSATDDSYHGDLPIHSLPIIFGNSSGIALASFNGKMDDVCIWNRALTPSEITQLYTDPSTTPPVECTPFLGEDQIVCAGTSVALSASSTSSSAACPTLPSNLQTGLVGYWPFCGNANDASGNGNNGTVNGATLTTDRFGNGNSAYSFDGVNDGIITPDYNFPYSNSNRTMSFWMKNENTGSSCSIPVRYGMHNASNGMWILHNNSCNTSYSYGTIAADFFNVFLVSQTTISNNEWHFISVTIEGQNCKLYADGILIGENNLTVNTIPANGSFYIGSDMVAPGANFFQGLIDEIAIYNRALSGSEIQQFYNQNSTSYLWSNGATTSTINVSPTSTTTYTCTVTTNGVSCTDAVTVVVSNPVIDLGADVTVCGTSTTLTAPSGYESYLWSNGGTTNTTTVTANGTYSCAVTQGGCSATDAVDVTLVNATVSASDSTICAGETVTLSIPQGGSTNTACPTLPTNLQTGLVGYWPFCGNANDASGNGNNGTVNGATLTTDRFGNANNAYSFDGVNDYITIDANNIDLSNDFTLSLYFQNNGNNIYGDNWRVLFSNIAINSNEGIAIFLRYNQLQFIVGNGNIFNQTVITNITQDINFNHLVIKKGLNSFQCFLNNSLVYSNSLTINYSNVNDILIGNRLNGQATAICPSDFYFGKIDDVSFWNRTLSVSEIEQLYTLEQTTYLWSTGATTATINVSPTSTTTYTCTVTTNGVNCTDSVTVVVSNPFIDLGADVTVCGTSTTLTAPSGYDSYLWSNGGTTNTTTVTANGTFSCTVTQGGCSATDAIDVTLINAAVSATDSTICAGETVTLSVPQGGSTSTACAALPTNLQTGLVGYWPFCGNANDESGNGNNGTVNGATLTTDRFGNANSAYSFDGIPDRIDLGQNLGIPIGSANSSWSCSAWINRNNYNAVMAITDYTGAVGGNDNVFAINLQVDQGVANAGIRSGSTEWSVTGGTITANQWHLIAWTVSQNGLMSLYVDGQFITATSFNSSSNFYENPNYRIGASAYDGNNNVGTGLIDNVTVHSRALSASEIQQLYTLGQTTYLWSNGATTPTINVSPTSTTTYTCTITTNGVSCTDSVTVLVSNPVVNLGADVTVCGTSTTLTAPSGYDSYVWSNGGTTNTTTVIANGTYSCTVTQGGCSATDAVDVTLVNATISASDSTICAGETVTLNATSAVQLSVLDSLTYLGQNDGHYYYLTNFTSNPQGQVGTELTPVEMQSIISASGAYLATIQSSQENSFIANSLPPDLFAVWIGLSDYIQEGSYVWLNGTPASYYAWRSGEPNNQGNEDFTIMYGATSYPGAFSLWNDEPCGEGSGPCNPFYFVIESDAPLQVNSDSFVWSTGAITPTINVSPTSTTTYTCTVTTNGVSCTDTVTVVVNNPVIDLGADVTVCGTSTTLTAPSGYDSYLWSNGGTTNTTTVNANGTYSCTATQGGCSASDSIDVTLVDATIAASDSTICAGETVTLSVPQGGSSSAACAALPTNLQTGLVGYWPFCGNANDASGNGNNGTVNGATPTSDRFGMASSAYDFNGSTSFINVPSASQLLLTDNTFTISAWGTHAGINDLDKNIVVKSNGIQGQPKWMFWYKATINSPSGLGFASNQQMMGGSQNNIVLNAWNHYLVKKTSDSLLFYINGILTSSTAVQFNNPNTAADLRFGGQEINGGAQWWWGKLDDIAIYNRSLNNTEIQQLYNLNSTTYLWSNGATTPTINVSPTTTTTYTCTVTTNGVSCTDEVTVVVSQPVASITPNGIVEICQGQSIALTANGGTSYLWNTGAPTQSITVNTEAVYTVTVTDANGCTDTESQLVKVNFLPNIGVNNASICSGQSTTLTATGGLTYVWSPATGLSNTTGTTVAASPSTSTVYTVTGTGANGCTNTATAAVSVNAAPTATITPATATTFCQGGSVVLTANTGTGLSYQWKLNGTNITGATSSSYTANASGSYTVVVTNSSTCSATSTATVVTVNALPTATITPATATTFCQGGSVVLTANTGTGLSYQWYNNASAISGATSSSYTANASGSYTVVVTNTSTCSATSTATVVTVNALPSSTITPATATTFCQGGSVVLSANTGTGLSYQWFNNAVAISGATSSSYTANASGSYTVVVTNTSTCSSTSTATVVTVNALPTATITPATATTFCQGGSVVLNANTGTGLSYQWRLNGTNITGATTSTYTANASGSYTVVVTNTSTCLATSTATVVTVNALPTATMNAATATTFCQGGSVVLNANTGTGLSYQWRLNGTNITGATSSSYTANASGSYTVVVTNASTCSSTSTATVVTVNALPTATITASSATTFCQGGSVVLNANTGAGLSYQWRLNGTNITGATTSSYTANASGSYTVVVTNSSTCSATSTATVVTVNALPTATIIPATATTFCQGGSVVLNANTGAGLSYQWFNNAIAISGATTSTYTANASGSYTVVVTNTSTCLATSTATVVTVNALPTATITPATATTFCQGGSVVLNANTGTGLSYQWKLNGTNITGATSSSYTANASGSYTVVVTNSSTCSATSTATVVTVNALPTATITPATATTFCQGGSVVLNANTGAGLTYQWRLNGTNITGATTSSYTANASGSYTVVVTNTSTCSATSTATVVTVNALPTAIITPATTTTFCQGGSVVLNANTGAGLSYQWRLNGTNITGATSSSYTANASGSYTVVVTNTSTCSATSTATVVTVNALPTATITPVTATTFCQGGSVVLNANTGTGLSYQWFNNAVAISGATSSSYTANASGSYTVVLTNTSTCSATSTATVVTVNALPTATITPVTATTFCQGGSVVLNANTGTGLSYQWRLNGTNITGATSSSYTANASGSYTVVVTNTSTCSATSTATAVTVNALPVASISPNGLVEICEGQSIALTANGGVSYLWSTGAPTQSITVNTEALYTVTVTDINGCTDTESQFVKVNQLPNIAVNNASICAGQSATLTATGGLSYVWSPATGLSATTGSTVSSSTTTNAAYTVTGTGANGCTNSATAMVTVNALPTATTTLATATTFCQGGSVVLNANTGTGLTYQWRLNGTNITGATSSSYTANASGSYTVVVTNTSTCSATSTAIDVTAVPNVDYFADADGDGFGDVTTLISTCVQPQGYVTDNTDCNDNDASIYPGAQEICNDVDDDCNDLIDDGLVFITYYADADGDSFGDINNPLDACLIPDGYVTDNTDCNDNNANQNNASTEICNSEDDDCDGVIDNGLIFLDYYADIDSDGFGAGAATNSCVDLGAGYVTNNTDCNDNNANQNTASTEICNGEDDDCDGTIDNGITFLDYYADGDGDGFGAGDVISSCSDLGAGYVSNNTDCDDSNSNTNPNATEACNTIDDNCDGQIDEGVQTVYFIDNDGDTYGNPSVSILACTQPIGYTPDDTDCNDTDANINPGAEDIGGNGIDENCDGEIDNSIFELNATISLYPNPTRSELNIQVNSTIIGNDLYIFDAVGKLVFKQQLLSTQTTVPVTNFADGNYVVRVGEVVKRFEVMK